MDEALNDRDKYFAGEVLNIGGTKKIRGAFRKPKDETWLTLNKAHSLDVDIVGDAIQLPLQESSFSTVLSTEVLEYLDDPDSFFSEINRVLKKGGHAILSVPFLHPLHGDGDCDLRRYTSSDLKRLSAKYGFELIELIELGGLAAVIFDMLRILTTYANGGRKRRFLLLSLFFVRPLFRIADTWMKTSRHYINTGYLVVIRKKEV